MIGTLAQAFGFTGLALLIVIAPWAFGGNVVWYRQWSSLGAMVTLAPAAVFLLVNRRGPNALRIPWLGYLLAAAFLLGLAQVIPLPLSVVSQLSPHAVSVQSAGSASVGEPMGDRLAISLYPSSTLDDLSLLGLCFAAYLIAATALPTRKAQLGLLAIIAANGTATAIFGLIQQLTFNGMLYWEVPLRFGGKPFAAFVNRNHAGGYLNMCLAASLAVIVYTLSRNQNNYGMDTEDFAQPYARGGTVRGGLRAFLANLDGQGLLSIAFAACAMVGTVCCLSRGAMLSLVAATLITTFAALRVRRSVTLVVGGVVVMSICIGLAVWLANASELRSRWGNTVTELEEGSNSRIDHWQDVTSVCRDYYRTGTGLGTYRYAYRPYESQIHNGWFKHAENQYLESFVELGWAGPTLILIAILTVFRAAIRLMAIRRDSLAFAVGVAGLFAIGSQAVHSSFDFGLYMPANALLCATLCGMVTAGIASTNPSRTHWSVPVSTTRRLAESLLLIATTGVLIWGGWHSMGYAAVQTALSDAHNVSLDQSTPLDETDEQIRAFQSALTRSSGNADAHIRIAELHIQRYRKRAMDALKQSLPWSDDILWDYTSPMALHGRSCALRKTSPERFQQLRQESVIQEEVVPAVKHLLAARQCCPLDQRAYFRLAELFVAAPDDRPDFDESRLVLLSVYLAPNNPDVLFDAGLLDWQAGRQSIALAEWRKSLSLSVKSADTMFTFLADEGLDIQQVISDLVPTDSPSIIAIGRQLSDPRHRMLLANRAEASLEGTFLPDSQQVHLQGAIHELKGQMGAAIDAYQSACSSEPSNLAWHYQLAKLLEREGRLDEAAEQAAKCVKLAPQTLLYRQLLRRIRLKRQQSGAP